ncbi:MAG: hypothetical protein LC104_14485 [Bacteroidales bacterium]|nr:hypothetical protein [Bacteroidales bacterium]
MTPEQEQEHERKLEAARKRWKESGRKPVIREIFGTPIRINGMIIDTAYVPDKQESQSQNDQEQE